MSFKRYLSFTQIAQWLSCRYKWSLHYADRLVPRMDRAKLDLGAIVHAGTASGLTEGDEHSGIVEWIDTKRERVKLSSEEDDALTDLGVEALTIAKRTVQNLQQSGFETVYVDGQPLVENKLQLGLPDSAGGSYWAGIKGYVDWVAREKSTGFLWLVDFKVREAFQTEEAEEYAIQMAIYQHMLREQYGIDTAGSISWQIKSASPKEPKLNKEKKGKKSMSRALIATTWDVYKAALIREGIDPAEYEEEMKPKLDAIQWFRPARAYRSRREIESTWNEVVLPVAAEIARNHVEPRPMVRNLGFFNCSTCSYKLLCLEALRGGDVETMRKSSYVSMDAGKEDEQPEIAQWSLPEMIDDLSELPSTKL